MKVVLISEEWHGMIGIADTVEHAVDFLNKHLWYDENNRIIEQGYSLREFNEKYDRQYYLNEFEVYTGE